MITLILMNLLMFNHKPIDLTNLNIYKTESVFLYKIQGNYLICSTQDNALSLFDASGKLIKSINDPGIGPGQLHRPAVFGITKDAIIILNNQRAFSVYSHQLELFKDRPLPPFPTHKIRHGFLPRGTYLENQTFLFINEFSSHAYSHIQFDEGTWKVDSFIQIPNNQDSKSILVHNDLFFITTAFQKEEYYELEVHQSLPKSAEDKDHMVQVLRGNITAFPRDHYLSIPYKIRGSIRAAAKIPEGYLVEFVHHVPGNDTFYWDFYDNQGTFLKRTKQDLLMLLPVTNDAQVFAIEDGEHLLPIESVVN